MFYTFLKKILFQLDAEVAHKVALTSLKFAHHLGLKYSPQITTPFKIMGIQFPNRIGLAAGMDKNGDYIDALAALGFGFIEVGTVTPKAQAGNPKPRLFRLTAEEAIINRMGFNNKGADYLVGRLQKTKFNGVLGINIGKNSTTPIEHAIDDYIVGFQKLAAYASYIVVNVSSPNTASLRTLQQTELLSALLQALDKERQQFFLTTQKYVPLVVKIAPDLSSEEISQIAEVLLATKIDGVIATNTTVNRVGVENSPYAKEVGGLSGKPLTALSTKLIRELRALLGVEFPIIASGGVMSAADAAEKIAAGADLVQLYSGLIYRGPGLVGECVVVSPPAVREGL